MGTWKKKMVMCHFSNVNVKLSSYDANLNGSIYRLSD